MALRKLPIYRPFKILSFFFKLPESLGTDLEELLSYSLYSKLYRQHGIHQAFAPLLHP